MMRRLWARALKTWRDAVLNVAPMDSLSVHKEFFPRRCPWEKKYLRWLAAPWNFAPRFELALKRS